MQADRDGQAADFAAAYDASEMRGRVQQELKAAGATTEPNADLDGVLLVRRGTTVPAWHAWLTLHKVRASQTLSSAAPATGIECIRSFRLMARHLRAFSCSSTLASEKFIVVTDAA